jgi:anti-sigma regulatory factor (Ser/Thr protein kinase)
MKLAEKFQISNSTNGLNKLKVQLESIALSWRLTKKQLFEINLIIEEICTNHIEHAESNAESFIGIKLCLEKSKILITITDNGPEFNPTEMTDPDINVSITKRKAGGLGLYLVRHYADSITYTRTQHTNRLYIEKNLY